MRRPKISGRKRASTGSDITVNPGDSYFIQLEHHMDLTVMNLLENESPSWMERSSATNGIPRRAIDKEKTKHGADRQSSSKRMTRNRRSSRISSCSTADYPVRVVSSRITFFYDARMETEEKSYPISIVNWKSFRIKRCTVNTLSAECQAMLQGVGALHWLRFLIQEIHGQDLR